MKFYNSFQIPFRSQLRKLFLPIATSSYLILVLIIYFVSSLFKFSFSPHCLSLDCCHVITGPVIVFFPSSSTSFSFLLIDFFVCFLAVNWAVLSYWILYGTQLDCRVLFFFAWSVSLWLYLWNHDTPCIYTYTQYLMCCFKLVIICVVTEIIYDLILEKISPLCPYTWKFCDMVCFQTH